jgi:Ion channel
MTALGGGAAFASVVGKHVSTWDGIWWAVSTMTTVGYGDLYPTTTAGRAIAIIVMLVGIGLIAIVTAAIDQKFVVAGVTTEIDTVELEADEDLQAVEAHVLGELRDLQGRLAPTNPSGMLTSPQWVTSFYARPVARTLREDRQGTWRRASNSAGYFRGLDMTPDSPLSKRSAPGLGASTVPGVLHPSFVPG